jgi:hypothetical protein
MRAGAEGECESDVVTRNSDAAPFFPYGPKISVSPIITYGVPRIHEFMDIQNVEKSLLDVIGSFVGQLPAEQLTDMADLVRAGERGIAFENLCTQLYEYDVLVSSEAMSTFRAIGLAMGVDSKYCDRLETVK